MDEAIEVDFMIADAVLVGEFSAASVGADVEACELGDGVSSDEELMADVFGAAVSVGIICSVEAGADVGAMGRGDLTDDSAKAVSTLVGAPATDGVVPLSPWFPLVKRKTKNPNTSIATTAPAVTVRAVCV